MMPASLIDGDRRRASIRSVLPRANLSHAGNAVRVTDKGTGDRGGVPKHASSPRSQFLKSMPGQRLTARSASFLILARSMTT